MNITIETIEKSYGDIIALDGPSFDIPSGSTFGVLGTNGAGKTTLFRLLVGHDTPDNGTISVGGMNTETAGDAVRHQIGYLPEEVGFPGLLTGIEVLELHAQIHQLTAAATKIEKALERVGLDEAGDRKIEGYSNGMRRRLGLAAAILAEPAVLVLDEPTAGLDPRGVESFHRIIERINQETDATVVLTSHVLSEVERGCDRIAILHEGRLCAAGTVEDLTLNNSAEATVELLPPNEVTKQRLTTKLDSKYDCRVVEGAIRITCHPSAIPEVLGSIPDGMVSTIDIEKPGLTSAFHAVIDREQAVSPT